MKKQHLLLTFFVMFFALSLVFLSSYVAAQNAKEDNKQVKVTIKQNINGESKTIEKTFSLDDEGEIEELLKEFDVNLNPDDLDGKQQVEITIRKTTKGEADDENNVVVDVQRTGGDADAGEARAFLGVYTRLTFDEDGNAKNGVAITEVIPGTAAEEAGLKADDVILKVNDKGITSTEQFREVIRSYKPQDEVTLLLLRDGKEQTVKTTLKETKTVREFHFMPNEGFDWNGSIPQFNFDDGSHIGGEKARPFLGIVPDDESLAKPGVVVEEVIEKSPAQEIGLQKGDVITKLNDKPVPDFDALRAVIRTMKAGDDIKVEYQRDGKTATASGKLGSKGIPEKMCLHFGDDNMADCAEKWSNMMNDDMTKEKLEGAVQRMEKEIEILKGKIEALDLKETEEQGGKAGDEETKISITIEDAVPSTLDVNALQFSPNPNDGKFNVSFELPQKGKTVVRIFDSSNKEIYKEDLGKFSGKYTKLIDISDNPRGIYFLQITQNDKAMNKKIVIQ